jgi:hypothetical protein
MNTKLSGWLRKDIRLNVPLLKHSTPSSFVRKAGKVFQVLLLLVLCAFGVWRVLLYRDVHGQLARIRAAGLPASGDELNLWCRSVSDAQNGALVLTQAFALLNSFPDNRAKEVGDPSLLARTNAWSPRTRALAKDYVQTNAAALARAQEGLRLSHFCYPVDFSYGPESQLSHLSKLKELARVAGLQAALDAEDGHASQWSEMVSLQLKLASTLNEEPAVISHLARAAIIRLAVKTTERSLASVGPSAEECQKLQAAFRQVGETNLLPQALIGERAILIPVFRLSYAEIKSFSREEEPGSSPRQPQRYSGKPMPLLWLTGFFERDLSFYLETMDKSIAMAALPQPQNLAMTNYLEAASWSAHRRACLLSEMLLPSLSRLAVREASTQALSDLAVNALAVERFCQRQGRLPGSLGKLTPEFLDSVPADPFNGAPLRYRGLSPGYVIYSVGADGHDDGGREPPERKKVTDSASYDITFTVDR